MNIGKSATYVRGISLLVVVCLAAITAITQTDSSYQPGTVMSVKDHQPAAGEDSSRKQYDISIQVKKTIYTVLFTPPPGSNVVEYKEGLDVPVLVSAKTITLSDMTGTTITLPILSRTEAPTRKAP